MPKITREQLIACGFLPKQYPNQEGEFLTKQLIAADMPYFSGHVVDNVTSGKKHRIVVEVCPNNMVQLVDQDSDYTKIDVPLESEEGLAMLEDAGFSFNK